ncbi:MAG TPA: hypothetical protein ENH62_17505 [Marinobacter sp.]|uniref:Uncharacterized protein n=1 Tax=marine sediment metagenome TaxID=412755 RepID=A0A0F9MQ00_9ZZZZ|nr:hypothetical protein [Marinobacter sp.]
MQPQLLQIPLNKKDIIYTPPWVAADMVNFFQPKGRILEPCKGDGIFLKYLPPHTEWCEIEAGRDFFTWTDHVNWIIGNPPYSAFSKWVYHAMNISDNIVYLVPSAKAFYSEKLLDKMFQWGRLKHNRVYGGGHKLNFPIGFVIAALHWQRDYHGPMYTSKAQPATIEP